ncbi:O-antigen ligase family protein [Acidovorax radicis]|uniref:O-antigen ligase family protein n=1 Tax=Acidovorax radicis TaxID=758826 RepID=UPI001CF7F37C|nr:O-antigen ligase family protein [Acidovorax radicis]UCU99088.1 O-antigen ligase family protein [Acidovorax radicis]
MFSAIPIISVHQQVKKWATTWFASLLCIALLLPNHYSPWLSFHQEWLSVLAICPLVGWALWRQYIDTSPKIPWITVASLFGVSIALLQLLIGEIKFQSDALLASIYWLLLGATTLVGYHFSSEECSNLGNNGMRSFWLAWIFAGLISFAIANHQWLDLSLFGLFIVDFPKNGRPFANLAQPNHLATLFLLSIIGSFFLYESRSISAVTATLLVTIFCQGLAMTQSRSVIIGLVLAGFINHFARPQKPIRTTKWIFFIVIILYFLLVAFWPFLNKILLITDAAQSSLTRSSEPGIRITYWLSSLDAIAIHPWFGWGFGQIGMAQQATALGYQPTHTFFSSSHNIILDLMLWMGIPCTLIIIILIKNHFLDILPTTRGSINSWSAVLGLACILGHALVELPLLYTYFLIPTGFLCGMATSKNNFIFKTKNAIKIHNKFILALSILCFLVFLQITFEYFKWEDDSRNLSFELQKYETHAAPFQPRWNLLDQISAMNTVARRRPTKNMSQEDVDLFKRNAERYPSSIALLRYAYAAALNGQPESSLHTLKLLCSLHKEAICSSARSEWLAAGQNEWPELQSVIFPKYN